MESVRCLRAAVAIISCDHATDRKQTLRQAQIEWFTDYSRACNARQSNEQYRDFIEQHFGCLNTIRKDSPARSVRSMQAYTPLHLRRIGLDDAEKTGHNLRRRCGDG